MRVFLYGLVRVLTFFVIAGICLLLETGFVVAVIVATVLTLAISYLFLGRLRRSATQEWNDSWFGHGANTRRGAVEQADADAEDAYTEGRFHDPAAGSHRP